MYIDTIDNDEPCRFAKIGSGVPSRSTSALTSFALIIPDNSVHPCRCLLRFQSSLCDHIIRPGCKDPFSICRLVAWSFDNLKFNVAGINCLCKNLPGQENVTNRVIRTSYRDRIKFDISNAFPYNNAIIFPLSSSVPNLTQTIPPLDYSVSGQNPT
jgi:hypothetical protein